MMDAGTAQLFTESLRRALRAEKVDAALDEVGWREALVDEGVAAAALLFAEQGSANTTSTALDDVLTVALGESPDAATAVVLPPFGRTEPPGLRGLATSRILTAQRVLVAGTAVAPDDLRLTPLSGVDPRLGLVSVETPAVPGPAADWPQAVAVGQIALAYELIGAARGMLRLAREHALTRIQFGGPIAGFQAVRHRLADALIAIESADAAAGMAVESGNPLLAGIAKAVAGRAARTVARHSQQVLAGVGFTTEHDFHHYVRRVLTLDGLLGDAHTLTRTLGESLLRTRQIPPVPPL
jgi:hypothetical protein